MKLGFLKGLKNYNDNVALRDKLQNARQTYPSSLRLTKIDKKLRSQYLRQQFSFRTITRTVNPKRSDRIRQIVFFIPRSFKTHLISFPGRHVLLCRLNGTSEERQEVLVQRSLIQSDPRPPHQQTSE